MIKNVYGSECVTVETVVGDAVTLALHLGCKLFFSCSLDARFHPLPLCDMQPHARVWLAELKYGIVQEKCVLVDADNPPRLSTKLAHKLFGWLPQMHLRVVFVSATGRPSGWTKRYAPNQRVKLGPPGGPAPMEPCVGRVRPT